LKKHKIRDTFWTDLVYSPSMVHWVPSYSLRFPVRFQGRQILLRQSRCFIYRYSWKIR